MKETAKPLSGYARLFCSERLLTRSAQRFECKFEPRVGRNLLFGFQRLFAGPGMTSCLGTGQPTFCG